MVKESSTILRVAVALLWTVLLLSTAQSDTLAHRVRTKLPILRLNYNVGVAGWNTTLDPANVAYSNDADALQLMHAGLVQILPPSKLNGPSKVALNLADKLTISKNRKVYTFHIRKRARFSNGDKVTAQDVVWSIGRAASDDVDPQESSSYDDLIVGLADYNKGSARKIPGLKAIGTDTVQITISKPAAYFLASFAYPVNDVLDRRVMAGHKVGDMTTTCSLQVGAGPFKPVCQNKSSDVTSFYKSGMTPTLTLRPNAYYYGHKPRIQLQLPSVESGDTAYNLYKSGQLDVSAPTPISELPQWKGKKDYREWGTSIVRWIQMDVTSRPFNNIHCRLAVAHAVNRERVAKQIVPGIARNLYTVVPPHFLGSYNGKATANKKGGTPWYSPALAKKELAQCPGGINVEWPYRVTTADSRRVRDALGSMLEQAGIHVKFRDITSQENARYQSSPMSETGVKMLRSGWVADYPDPHDYLSLLLRSGRTYAITGWSSSTFDGLVDRADVETNRKKRAQMYIQAQKLAISQGIWVPLWNDIGVELVKPYVKNLVFNSAFSTARPIAGDWSRVTVGKH